jgi:hypothetical protein
VRKWQPAILIGFSLDQVGIGNKTKLMGRKREECLAFLSAFFCGGNHLIAKTGGVTVKRGPWPNFTPMWLNFELVRNKILIARFKIPEYGHLLSPTPPLCFYPSKTDLGPWSLTPHTTGAQLLIKCCKSIFRKEDQHCHHYCHRYHHHK